MLNFEGRGKVRASYVSEMAHLYAVDVEEHPEIHAKCAHWYVTSDRLVTFTYVSVAAIGNSCITSSKSFLERL